MNQNIKKYDVFIIYREDYDAFAARSISEKLEAKNLRVFAAYKDIRKTKNNIKDLEKELKNSATALLIVTPNTFDPTRIFAPKDYVRLEINWANEAGIPIVPVNTNNKTIQWGPGKINLPEDVANVLTELSEEIMGNLPPGEFEAKITTLIERLEKHLPNKPSAIDVDRQIIQAKNTSKFLERICKKYARMLCKKGRSNLKVLDVGCGNGLLGQLCFRDPVYSKVYGIDNNDILISLAQSSVKSGSKSKYTYKVFDIAKLVDSPPETLLDVLGDGRIQFDIIFCSMVFHNLKSDCFKERGEKYVKVIEILQKFKELLAPGGYLIVSNPDDASKLFYEDNVDFNEKQSTTYNPANSIKSTLDELVKVTSKIPEGPHRYCGRATYYWLAKAGFNKIDMRCVMQDTSDSSDAVKRPDLFEQLFGWQQNEINEAYAADLITKKERDKLRADVTRLTETIKNKLDNDEKSWLCSHDYVGIAENNG